MEPDRKELTDGELDNMLGEWKTPPSPARLREAIFGPAPAHWWRRMWAQSIRVPLPVAAGIVVLLAAGAWRWAIPAKRERVVEPAQVVSFREFRPVTELRPRIIRRERAKD